MDVVLFLVTPAVAAILAAAVVALVPAIVSAWRDRVLLARGREDPALPERFVATRSGVILSIAGSIALMVTFWPWHALWALPLLFVTRRWVAYRLRRALLDERWSFPLYLSFFVRTALGLVAMPLLLAAMPAIVWAAEEGPPRWLVATLLTALLVWWQLRYARLLLWLWQATPIERDDLNAAFSAILAKAVVAPTRVWQAGPPGAVVANALALPSISESNVVMSRTLLERMTTDEIVAIFAHEVAHLEHFNRARMTRQRVAACVQIVAGALLVPVLTPSAPGFVGPMLIAWPAILVMIGLIARGRKVHGNELASDRRAVELCGNPEALMSALMKLHTISRLPRRWRARATKHPSLAQRMRAIREQAGFRAPAIEQTEIFASPARDAFLLLDRATLQHAVGVPPDTPHDPDLLVTRAHSVRRVDYRSIISCRIIAPWNRPAALQVMEQGGVRVQAQIRDEDLPRLHDLLDIIEFGMPVEKPAPTLRERDLAFGLLFVAIVIGPIWSLVALAMLAVIRPAAEMLIAASLALSLTGVLQWIDPTRTATSNLLPAWVVIALGGVAIDIVLWRLWSRRSSRTNAPAWCSAVVVAGAAIVWLHGLLQWDGSLLRLAQVARITPAAALLPLAGALLLSRTRVRGRYVFATALAIAAIVPGVIATRWFQDAMVRDPLLAASSPLPVALGEADIVGAVHNDRDSNELRLSPEGHVVATAATDEDTERFIDFTIRTPDGRTRDVHAADLQFLDDTRVLLLVNDTEGLALRLEKLADRNVEWSLGLPGMRWSRLSLSPQTQHWRVTGYDTGGHVARLQGSVGQSDYDDVRWTVAEPGEALVGSGKAMLVSRTHWQASLLGRLLPELAMMTARRSTFDVSLWRVRTGAPTLMARSSADVDCVEAPVDLDPAVCFAFDGIATRLWMLSAEDKRVTPIGVLDGYARLLTRGSDGTLVVWWRRHPLLLQLDPLRARALIRISASQWAHAALVSNHLLIGDDFSSSTLAIYRVQSEISRASQP